MHSPAGVLTFPLHPSYGRRLLLHHCKTGWTHSMQHTCLKPMVSGGAVYLPGKGADWAGWYGCLQGLHEAMAAS